MCVCVCHFGKHISVHHSATPARGCGCLWQRLFELERTWWSIASYMHAHVHIHTQTRCKKSAVFIAIIHIVQTQNSHKQTLLNGQTSHLDCKNYRKKLLCTHTHTPTRVNVITTGPVWSVSLSLGLTGCAGPQQLLYYSSRQGSLAESPVYKVQYKRTVGSPRDLAGKSLAKLKPHQPFSAAHANGTTHMYGTYGYTNLHTLSQLHTHWQPTYRICNESRALVPYE